MLLYDIAVSGNCYKVRLLLAQLGIPFERRELSVTDRTNRHSKILYRFSGSSFRLPIMGGDLLC